MTPKPGLFSGRSLVKIFKKMGFTKVSQKGSHIKMKNYESGKVAIIPDHKEVDRWTLNTLLKQIEISKDEFDSFLKQR